MKIILCPGHHDYVRMMKEKLIERGNQVSSIKYITPLTLLKIIFLRFKGYEIIHIHFVYSFSFTWLMKFFVYLAKFLGYKLAWTGHSIIPPEEKNVYKNRWFYKHADIRFIHHKAHLKLLEKQGLDVDSNICHIFHPGFYLYPNTISKKEARKMLGIPDNKKVLLAFGYIKNYKGLEYFVEALKNLGDEYYGLIVGEPSDKQLVMKLELEEKKIKNLRVIKKYVAPEEIQIYMNACDAVILPYLYIWTSGATMLSYAFSKPVVASRVGCMDEVVTKETGVLVPPEDAKALEEGIKKLFSKDYKEMGKKAYKMVKEKYNWDVMIDKTIQEYKKILNSRNYKV